MAKRLASGRREELIDGFMRLIAGHGFVDLRMSEAAGRLHCSITSLYKVAPSKEDLVVVAIQRWGRATLDRIAQEAARAPSPEARARAYYQAGAHSLIELSEACRSDIDRFESTRVVWAAIADEFIDTFTALFAEALAAGCVRPTNTFFLAQCLRQLSTVTRDMALLRQAGLTPGQALLEIDTWIWDGLTIEC